MEGDECACNVESATSSRNREQVPEQVFVKDVAHLFKATGSQREVFECRQEVAEVEWRRKARVVTGSERPIIVRLHPPDKPTLQVREVGIESRGIQDGG